ncbi:MAG: hypothetical protein PSV46_05010 [Reyranella sp.]|nr:hypothetical protein [Reyranella sp.]
MTEKLALTVLTAAGLSLPGVAFPGIAAASSEAECAEQWTQADTNHDGVIAGAEADRYLAYIRIRNQVTPPDDGRITQDSFMQACQNDTFLAKATEAGAPFKGANSFTQVQARDRAIAAGLTQVTTLVKDDDGIWRGTAKKGNAPVKVAVDFKGNVVVE